HSTARAREPLGWARVPRSPGRPVKPPAPPRAAPSGPLDVEDPEPVPPAARAVIARQDALPERAQACLLEPVARRSHDLWIVGVVHREHGAAAQGAARCHDRNPCLPVAVIAIIEEHADRCGDEGLLEEPAMAHVEEADLGAAVLVPLE